MQGDFIEATNINACEMNKKIKVFENSFLNKIKRKYININNDETEAAT